MPALTELWIPGQARDDGGEYRDGLDPKRHVALTPSRHAALLQPSHVTPPKRRAGLDPAPAAGEHDLAARSLVIKWAVMAVLHGCVS